MSRDKLVSIGFNKNLEADFGVSGLVCSLTLKEMQELREIAVVALYEMESMWRREQETKPENLAMKN